MTTLERAFLSWGTRVTARPRAVLSTALVALATASAFLLPSPLSSGLGIDFSPSAFFVAGDPVFDDLSHYRATFGRDDTQVWVVAEVSTGTLRAPARVRVLADLEETLRGHPSVAKVLGPAALLKGDAAEPGDDGEGRRPPAPRVAALLAEDATAGALLVGLDTDTDQMQVLRPLILSLGPALDQFDGREGIHLSLGGLPAVRATFLRVTLKDQLTFFPLALLLMGLLLAAIFRSWHGVLIPAVCAFSPVVLLLAGMAATDEPVGLVNQVYFTLIPALAVADAIHVVHAFGEERRRGSAPAAAAAQALSRVGPACLWTSVTTVLGFSSLSTSEIGVLQRFGLYAAVGVTLAFLVAMTALPALLALTRSPPRAASVEADARFARLADLVMARPRAVLAAFAIGGVGAGLLGAQVVVDNRLTTMLPAEEPASHAGEILDERLGGILPMALVITAPTAAAWARPDVVRAVDDVLAEARATPGVRSAQGAPDLLRALDRSLRVDASDAGALPGSAAAVAQYRLLLEDSERTFTVGNETRILLGLADEGGNATLAIARDLEEKAQTQLAPLGLTVQSTGTAYAVFSKLGHLTRDLRVGIGLALFAVLVSIGVAFRSLRLTLIAAVPNLLPLVFGVALVAGAGWVLDMGPGVIFTVALGIAVDDTIHILSRYQRERAAGADGRDALRRALSSTGRAVSITTLILTAGFLIHTLSSFVGIVTIGWLGAVVVLSALLCDLVLLPALLVVFGQGLEHEEKG